MAVEHTADSRESHDPPLSQDEVLMRDAIKSRLFPDLALDPSPPNAGRVGRFALLERVGKGGMGVVYAAYDDRLDRRVAIKLLRSRFDNEAARELLEREAKRLARLSHPNVVQIHEYGEHDGRVFVAMEYVVGQTLRTWLTTTRSWREVLPVLIQAGRGLVAAHEAGLVHRDFKPDNVLVGDDGRVRVLDFGLASFAKLELERTRDTTLDGSTTSDSQRASLAGTPVYMAPELFAGELAHVGSDQWAFCVVAWEALFGQRPFVATSADELIEHIVHAEPQRGGSVKLPARLERAILRGLAKRPSERWPELATLVAELDELLQPSGHRRASLGLTALLGCSLIAALTLGRSEPPTACELDEHALQGSWTGEQRSALARSFAASGHVDATAATQVVERAFDDWTARWLAARRRACVATWVDSAQSPAWLDAHNACLELQRQRFNGMVATLVDADRETVEHVTELLVALPDPTRCASALVKLESRTVGADERAELEQLHATLGRAVALANTGRVEDAAASLEALLAEARARGHVELAIEAHAEQGHLALRRWQLPEGLAIMQAAIHEAMREDLDELETELRVDLALVAVNSLGERSLKHWLVDEASAALRLPGAYSPSRALRLALARSHLAAQDGELDLALAELDRARSIDAPELALRGPDMELLAANVSAQLGQPERAEQTYVHAIELATALWGLSSPRVAEIELAAAIAAVDAGRDQLGAAHLERASGIYPGDVDDSVFEARAAMVAARLASNDGRFDAAQRLIEAALATFTRELGESHDETARAANGLGVIAFMRGDHETALLTFRRALALQQRNLGPRDREVGLLYSNIGESLLALDRRDEARDSFARALDILEPQLAPDDVMLALPLAGRGLAALAAGNGPAAIVDLERALAINQRAPDDTFELATQRFGLARALLLDTPDEAELRTRADQLSRDARTGFVALGLDTQIAELDAWRERQHLD